MEQTIIILILAGFMVLLPALLILLNPWFDWIIIEGSKRLIVFYTNRHGSRDYYIFPFVWH